MTGDFWPAGLYILNFALLFTHQVDSAYWQEWKLFHVPGGVQLNLILNFLLLLLALSGFVFVLQGAEIGRAFALLLAASGTFAFVIHAYFLVRGDASFRLPVSIAVLIGILAVSVAQAAVTLRAMPV